MCVWRVSVVGVHRTWMHEVVHVALLRAELYNRWVEMSTFVNRQANHVNLSQFVVVHGALAMKY